MILVTTPIITNKEIIETLGIARGSTVRARNVGQDIFAGLKNLIGGEISEYTKLQAQSREQALQRMQEDAGSLAAKENSQQARNIRHTPDQAQFLASCEKR